jgi:hypothetical protein
LTYGSAAGDQNARPRYRSCPANRLSSHRHRFHQRPGAEIESIGEAVTVACRNNNAFRKAPVDVGDRRSGADEAEICAEVIPPGAALRAGSALDGRLNGDPVSLFDRCYRRPNRSYNAGKLVSQDQGSLRDELADLKVLVVVDIGPADAGATNIDQDIR